MPAHCIAGAGDPPFFEATAKPLRKTAQKNHCPKTRGVASQIFNRILDERRSERVIR